MVTVMEQVRCAAAARMEFAVPTAQQVGPDYMIYRAEPLHNTFINLIDNTQCLHRRRSRSIASFLSTGDGTSSCSVSETYPADNEKDAGTQSDVASTGVPCESPDGSSDSEGAEAEASYTTIMLKNLPPAFTQMDLLEALDESGLQGAYDFCYLPASFRDGTCRGYAFINFTTHSVAEWFLYASGWQGSKSFCNRYHRKALMAEVAGIQGWEALMAQSTMKKLQRVKNPAYRPFVVRPDSM
mmetsp:Transcript_11493/g.26028  ORF Transcript_11493/g.26028 Transcript_11493/m.26028 type:complete len:241 (-) Transcript_11493:137-859(-)